MAATLGIEVETLAADWRNGADVAGSRDRWRRIRAPHQGGAARAQRDLDRAWSCRWPTSARAIDAAGHPALLLADTISSLGSIDFRMDEWGIDVVVGGSQKGLMLPTGMAFTASATRHSTPHARRSCRATTSTGNDERPRAAEVHGHRAGAYVLRAAGGRSGCWRRKASITCSRDHARLGEATRARSAPGAATAGPQLYCQSTDRRSNTMTAVMVPDGVRRLSMRKTALDRFNVSLGGGLDRSWAGCSGSAIWAISTSRCCWAASPRLEMKTAGVPYSTGGVDAAMRLQTKR